MNQLERMLCYEKMVVKITAEAIKRALKPTERQLDLIEKINHTCGISFVPKDKYDAQKFISTWIDVYIDERIRGGFLI